jgi:hypothetical protein
MASTAYADEVKRVRSLGVEPSDIARATGAEIGTVSSWVRATRSPGSPFRERLLALISVVDRLALSMDPRYVPLWLNKPLPALDDETPLAAIASGGYKDVSRLVAQLENDSFS